MDRPLEKPADLAHVPFLVDTNPKSHGSLRFRNPEDGTTYTVPIHGPVSVNSPITTMRGAIAGLGVALFGADFLVRMQDAAGYFYMTVFDKWSKDIDRKSVV